MLFHSSSATERTARSSSKEKGRRVRFSPRWLTVLTSSAGLSAISPSRFAERKSILTAFRSWLTVFGANCLRLAIAKVQDVLTGNFAQVRIGQRAKVSEEFIHCLRVEL